MKPGEILRQTDFFKGVSPKSRDLLAAHCIPKSVRKREVLFAENDPGHSVYLLASGAVQLSRFSADGKETVIKIVEPGEMFAEVVLFENNRYPVTATALTRSLLYLLPKHEFNCLLENNAFRSDFFSSLMRKLRFLAEQIQSLSTQTAEERLLRFIRARDGENRAMLSKKDIASAIGANPETLSRVLASLKTKGLIKIEGKVIRLTKASTL